MQIHNNDGRYQQELMPVLVEILSTLKLVANLLAGANTMNHIVLPFSLEGSCQKLSLVSLKKNLLSDVYVAK